MGLSCTRVQLKGVQLHEGSVAWWFNCTVVQLYSGSVAWWFSYRGSVAWGSVTMEPICLHVLLYYPCLKCVPHQIPQLASPASMTILSANLLILCIQNMMNKDQISMAAQK